MLAIAVHLTFGLLVLGAILALLRLLLGPSLPDRVVALDLLQVLAVALGAVFSVESGQALYLDVSIALALIGFLGAVAFARYAELRHADRRTEVLMEPRRGRDPERDAGDGER